MFSNTYINWTPLHVATSEGHVHTVQYLLDHKADPKLRIESGWTALHLSFYYGRADVLKILLQRLPRSEDEIYSDGYRPLHKAAEKGDVEVIQMLLDAGTKINAGTINEQTALYVAVRLKNLDAAQELLRKNANVNSPTHNGWTPLHIAVDTGSESIIRLLLAHGADVTREDKTGQTALAQAQGKWQLVDILSPSTQPTLSELDNRSLTSVVSAGNISV